MEEHKHFKNTWKDARSSETERIRSNTLPRLPSDEQLSQYDMSNSYTLTRPYSCELYGIDEELSMRFQDRMWKINNDRVNTWILPRHNYDIKNLNWSMQCNKGSFMKITTPVKDQLEHMKVVEESGRQVIKESVNQPEEKFAYQSEAEFTYQPERKFPYHPEEEFVYQPENAAAIKSIVLAKKPCPYRKSEMKSEISAKQKPMKRYSSKPINGDTMTPRKKLRNCEAILDDLRPLAPSDYPDAHLPTTSATGNHDKHKVLQASFLCNCSILVLLSVILTVFISVFLYENQETRKHSNDYANAVVELKKRIYGQDHSVRELCEYLQNDVPSFRVMILFGDTGVGKSYTVEIIRKNFPRKYAIRQYFPPLEAVTDINLPLLYPNLIILENLREHDLTDIVNFLKARQDMYRNRLVTVLAVFNFEQIVDNLTRTRNRLRDASKIENTFLNQSIEVEIFFYEPLSKYALEMCIMDAIEESKLTLNTKQFDIVKENLLINEAGCKGAYRQVQLIGRQHE